MITVYEIPIKYYSGPTAAGGPDRIVLDHLHAYRVIAHGNETEVIQQLVEAVNSCWIDDQDNYLYTHDNSQINKNNK